MNKEIYDYKYSIDAYKGEINEDVLYSILAKNTDKMIKAIMIDYPKSNYDSKPMNQIEHTI